MNSYKHRYIGRYAKGYHITYRVANRQCTLYLCALSITHMFVGVIGEPKLVVTDRRETW